MFAQSLKDGFKKNVVGGKMEQKKTEQMEEVKDIFQVESFVLQCNDMLGGKFLDLNKRLDKFLAEMTASEDILQLLADALEGFDHEKEFASAFFFFF